MQRYSGYVITLLPIGLAGLLFIISPTYMTVMLEKPKLAPHREAIHASLAAVLGSVNVKATTGEGMGFVGRGEGVAALAVATLLD